MEKKSDHSYNDKVKSYQENIVVTKEEWFADINSIDGVAFPTFLIKRAKSRFNQK